MYIIFQNDAGGVAIITPAPVALEVLGVEAIAQKDVPFGKPYKIIQAADLPADTSARDAWEIDPALLTDGVGADFGAGSLNDVIGYDANMQPIIKRRPE